MAAPQKNSVTITRDEWLDAIGESIEPADPNAITTTELAQLLGIGRTAARAHLARLVAEGKARITSKIVRSGLSATRCAAYALVKDKKR